ncbi:MAG TPA: flavin reductase family protein [Candidatus Limnocylindria bacterium]|nr:flavin reductase family protein [Candidatus Limnocylindria bacterium]
MRPTEHRQAAGFDQRELRNALGTFATGVTIVTTCAPDGTPLGLTANSFSSVSLDPPLVLWSLSRFAPSLTTFQRAAHFAVNVLGTEHRELSIRFARGQPDKFAGVDYVIGTFGVPLIAGTVAQFECRVADRYYGGDHEIFLGRVERYAYERKPPLLYCHGAYHRAHPIDGDEDED